MDQEIKYIYIYYSIIYIYKIFQQNLAYIDSSRFLHENCLSFLYQNNKLYNFFYIVTALIKIYLK